MNLLVDIGNTSVKWACANGLQFVQTGRFEHAGGDPDAQMEQAWGALPVPGRVMAANVAGGVRATRLCAWVERAWQLQPAFIRAARQAAGITNAYTEPAQLGADRWAAMIAAWHAIRGAVCVVDCGTAITIDLIDTAGQHRGGQILPGVTMMRHALGTRTAQLPRVHGQREPVLLARDTEAAIYSGSLYAAAAAIERIVADMATATGLRPELVLTGGAAALLTPQLLPAFSFDADLVLKGIALLAGDT